jgi:hypothetical protein
MNAPLGAALRHQMCQAGCGPAAGFYRKKFRCQACINALELSQGRRDPLKITKPCAQSQRWASTFGPLVLPNEGAGEAVERRAYVPPVIPRMVEYVRDVRSIPSLYPD